ncbi:hypothetical protein Taro_004195 [Colocasia esculenta]|uniref:Uncharacterized protein n=1 Tax=Colocasia esculenta TaxID=4460 RepID=A0A843TLR4_COLES|nr:hypothetical protein [Colocasia esculenta]
MKLIQSLCPTHGLRTAPVIFESNQTEPVWYVAVRTISQDSRSVLFQWTNAGMKSCKQFYNFR